MFCVVELNGDKLKSKPFEDQYKKQFVEQRVLNSDYYIIEGNTM